MCWPTLPCQSYPLFINKQPDACGNKKGRGSKFLRAYPYLQALALPPLKDKQRKACPRRTIYMHAAS